MIAQNNRCANKLNPGWGAISGSDLWSDQVQRTRCVPRPKLQALGFGSSAQYYDQSAQYYDPRDFGLGMVWSEVILVCGWYDQRSLQDGNGQIRGGFKRTLVWWEIISSKYFFFWFFCTEKCWLCQEATKSSIQITDTSRVWWLWSEPNGSSR